MQCLPNGDVLPCRLLTAVARQLDIEFAPGSTIPLGALVEVRSSTKLYLGQVQGFHSDVVTIHVEHAVTMQALAAIDQAWRLKT